MLAAEDALLHAVVVFKIVLSALVTAADISAAGTVACLRTLGVLQSLLRSKMHLLPCWNGLMSVANIKQHGYVLDKCVNCIKTLAPLYGCTYILLERDDS